MQSIIVLSINFNLEVNESAIIAIFLYYIKHGNINFNFRSKSVQNILKRFWNELTSKMLFQSSLTTVYKSWIKACEYAPAYCI